MRQYFTRTRIDVADAHSASLRCRPLSRSHVVKSAVHALADVTLVTKSALDASWWSQVIFATRAGRLSRWGREALQAPVNPDA